MDCTRTFASVGGLIEAYDRLVSAGLSKEDIVTIIRGVLGQFLFRLTYLLDDNSLEDEELREQV
jgi:hypothetical protein